MSLLVSNGTELIRYNTSSADIEFSNNRGMTWFVRSHGRDMGNVRAMTLHKGEIILCSDRGIFLDLISRSVVGVWLGKVYFYGRHLPQEK